MHEVIWGMQAEKDASGSISISAGDTVRWVFEGRHSVESGTPSRPDGLFSSGRPGARSTYDFRFTKPGVYPYFCRSHSGMVVSRVTVLGPEGELYTWGRLQQCLQACTCADFFHVCCGFSQEKVRCLLAVRCP